MDYISVFISLLFPSFNKLLLVLLFSLFAAVNCHNICGATYLRISMPLIFFFLLCFS